MHRSSWIVFELAPQMRHMNAQIMVMLDPGWTPDIAKQLPVSEYAARIGYQGREKAKFDRGELNRCPLFSDTACR